MVPYNGETDFRDVWSYHDLVSGFLKSGVHINVKKVTHASTTQNTGWDSAFIKKQNAHHHSHAVFASVTLMHQGDTFKFVSVGAGGNKENRNRAANLAIGLHLLNHHSMILKMETDKQKTWRGCKSNSTLSMRWTSHCLTTA